MLYMRTELLIKTIRGMIDTFFATDVFHKRPNYYNCISFPIRIHHYFESGPTEGGFIKNYVIPFYVDYGDSFLSDSFHVRISRDCRSPVSDPEISVNCCLGKQALCNELKDYILRHLPIKKVPSVTYDIKVGCNEVNLTQAAIYEKMLKCESEVNKKMLNGKYGFKLNDNMYNNHRYVVMRNTCEAVANELINEFFSFSKADGVAYKKYPSFMERIGHVGCSLPTEYEDIGADDYEKTALIECVLDEKCALGTGKRYKIEVELYFRNFVLYNLRVNAYDLLVMLSLDMTDVGSTITTDIMEYLCNALGLKKEPTKKHDPEYCNVICPRGCGKTIAQMWLLEEARLAGKHVAFINRNYMDTDMYKKCMDYCKADLDICSRGLKALHKEYLDRRDNANPNPLWTDQGLNDTGILINSIEKVIFNNPATIVFWKDGTKTTVTAKDEPFDEEKGLAMAIAKKAFGNNYAAGGRFKAIMKHADRVEKKEKKAKVEKLERPKITKTGFIKEKMAEGFTRKEATEMWERNSK